MELRTTFKIEPSPYKITYMDPVMFIGSCFSSLIGSRMETGHMPVMINPSGTVYNPVSVVNTLETIISGREYNQDDLFFFNGTWISFHHYTDFSSDDPSKTIQKINTKSKEALSFLKKARFLFITFGTARVYRHKKSGEVVSNCHKIPAGEFDSELLSVNEIVNLWSEKLDKLQALFPSVKVIFTISPVRHWKDGAHGNQVSKSVLFLAVEELLSHSASPQYFPAYELMMDDLRDYRFYKDDMLHPSNSAIDYIWEAFSGCYMDKQTVSVWRLATKISKALDHRLNTGSQSKINDFARRMLQEISDLESRVPGIDLTYEKNYFIEIMKP
jgi:hypothetical protein